MLPYDLLLAFVLALLAWAGIRLTRAVEAHRQTLAVQGTALRRALDDHTRVLEDYTQTVRTAMHGTLTMLDD